MKSRELLKPWRNSCSFWCYDSVPTAAHMQPLMHTHTQHRANQEMLRFPQEHCGKSELPGSRSQGKDFPSLCQHLSPFAPNPNYTFRSAFTQQMFTRGQTCPCRVRCTWRYQVNNHRRIPAIMELMVCRGADVGQRVPQVQWGASGRAAAFCEGSRQQNLTWTGTALLAFNHIPNSSFSNFRPHMVNWAFTGHQVQHTGDSDSHRKHSLSLANICRGALALLSHLLLRRGHRSLG